MEPFSLSLFLHRVSHNLLNSSIDHVESNLSHSPLLTHTIFPAWMLIPPFDKKYGGSAKIKSNLKSKRLSKSVQSPCRMVKARSLDLKYGMMFADIILYKSL